MHLAVPRAVTTPNEIASSTARYFAPACLASLGCMLACMPACLLDNSTIILILMVVKSLKLVFLLFFKSALFSCIKIYDSDIHHAITWHLTLLAIT